MSSSGTETRVAELEGAELDYWVAKAEGKDPDHAYQRRTADGSVYLLDRLTLDEAEEWAAKGEGRSVYRYIAPYSTLWAAGGEIIEREHIDLLFVGSSGKPEWIAGKDMRAEERGLYSPLEIEADFEQRGPTPLIAAMRAYVASKYGDTVPA